MTDIIIPIKRLENAKQRLMGVLSPGQREELVLAMLRDLLRAVRQADCRNILVVASDEVVFDIARQFGARPVPEQDENGYNSAVSLGFAEAGDGNVAVLPGDLPLASAEEINCLCATAETNSKCIRLAASHDRRGTNGVFLASRDLIKPGFGMNSLARYMQTARSKGIEPTLIEAPGLARDIDTPGDLCDLMETGCHGATLGVLERIGGQLEIAKRDRGVA